MRVDGACHCGDVAFEAEVDPRHVVICHCEDCQTFGGGPFRVRVLAPAGALRLLRGAPSAYTKTAESGNERLMFFCPRCGTQTHATEKGEGPRPSSISAGVLSQKATLRPVAQYWCASRLDWLDGLSSVHRVERQSLASAED